MKKNSIIISIIILVVILTIGGIFLVPYLQSVTGFSTLALSKVSLRSDSEYLDGEQWLLTVAQGTLAQRAEGTFTPDDIQDATSDDSTTTNNFQISVNYQDQSCEYPIQRGGADTPIYQLDKIEWFCLFNPSENDAYKKLKDNGISADQAYKFFGQYHGIITKTCYVVYWTEKTPVGTYGNTNIRSKMNIAVLAGTRSDDVTLDTLGDAQAPLSDFAYVIWVGNLDSGKSCSYTTDMPYLPAYKSGRWININKNYYASYLNKLDNTPPIQAKKDDIANYINDVNSARTKALISQNFGYFDNEADFEDAILKESIKSPLQYPVLTFYVKADTLGIYTPAPKIKLISASSPTFKTGNEGIIYLEVKNLGDEAGTWNFYGDCNNNFKIPNSRQYSVDAGETKKVTLPITASADKKIDGSCRIYAENVAGTEQITVQVSADPLQTCIPNQKYCGSSGGADVVFKCSSDGARREIFEVCQTGFICENGKCKDPGSGGGGWWDKIKEFFDNIGDFFTEFVLIISVIIGLLATIIGYAFYERFSKFLKLKQNKFISIVVGILLGILAGYLFYSLFWWGIVALIIYMVISFIIPKK